MTATFYLLAERKLRAHRQDEVRARATPSLPHSSSSQSIKTPIGKLKYTCNGFFLDCRIFDFFLVYFCRKLARSINFFSALSRTMPALCAHVNMAWPTSLQSSISSSFISTDAMHAIISVFTCGSGHASNSFSYLPLKIGY